MPANSPFTRLCQLTSQSSNGGKADLHVHSTASDGLFQPAEVIARGRQAGLKAVAITDHDTLDGYQAVYRASAGIELIAGVEITSEYLGRELHLLGYFVDPEHPVLAAALTSIREQRIERFDAIARRLRGAGASINLAALCAMRDGGSVLGRRHLARLLVESRQVGNVFEAFARYLSKPEFAQVPKSRLPVADAIAMVRASGGVSSWAHPPSDATVEQARNLQALGLHAMECEYPWSKPSHGRRLRTIAADLGLAITGGSDCHGPQPNKRAIGVKGINLLELEAIRSLRPDARPDRSSRVKICSRLSSKNSNPASPRRAPSSRESSIYFAAVVASTRHFSKSSSAGCISPMSAAMPST